MFRFENPYMLAALILLPLMGMVFGLYYFKRRRRISRIGDPSLVKLLMPGISNNKQWLKFLLMMLSGLFLVIAMGNPQTGSKLEKVKRKGVDIMIALDVSNSMNAKDIKPDRLTAARQAISRFISQLHTDRLGMIVFAGEAYVQLPVTTDFSAARLFLETIDTDIVPVQGTAIGKALELAMKSFDDSDAKNKTIIVITDGEDHDQDAMDWAAKAAKSGITVHAIGLGSISGAPIPEYENGREKGYKKDRDGNTVITKLNEEILMEIASLGKGIYIRGNSSGLSLKPVLDEINKMEKVETGSLVYTDYEDGFQYFLAIAILFLILESLVFERRTKWLSSFRFWGDEDKGEAA